MSLEEYTDVLTPLDTCTKFSGGKNSKKQNKTR